VACWLWGALYLVIQTRLKTSDEETVKQVLGNFKGLVKEALITEKFV
jgi:hypothetical protein